MSVRAGELWDTFMRGWTHGAGMRPLDPKFTQHTRIEICEAYAKGYEDGRASRNSAAQTAAQRFGYTPTVLRLQDES